MAMSMVLQEYLNMYGVDYEIIPHKYTRTSMNTVLATHVPAEQLAKSVVLEDETGYVMAVIPAMEHVKLGKISHLLDRRLGLATEEEFPRLFKDCDLGAIPPVGQAFSMEVVVDDSLDRCSDIYFESGDHVDLIHMKGHDFHNLMRNAHHSRIC